MTGYAYRSKRLLDLALLAVSAPLTIPGIVFSSALVLISDGRPIFFRQERAGLHGAPFDILKFRTMRTSVEVDVTGLSPSAQITKSDTARVTRIGRLLRKTSLDELPQLLNVLRGEMSVVGPRPLFVRYNPFYTERENLRLSVLPGITGYSQVSGRNHGGWKERLEYDARYVERASLKFDLHLIIRTAMTAVRSDGVSVVAGDTGDALDDERGYPKENGVSMRRIYARDLPERVRWLNSPDSRRNMTLDGKITLASTKEWHRSIKENPLRRDYVFETADGQLVAMSGVKAKGSEGVAEFYVFVNPDSQNQGYGGIATRLTLRESAREGVFEKVWLSVVKDNHHAVSIYRRMGFEEVEDDAGRFAMEVDLAEHRD